MADIDIDIRELFFDILSIVKFELKFYQDKESPMFDRIVKTRVFQQTVQKLKDLYNLNNILFYEVYEINLGFNKYFYDFINHGLLVSSI